MDAAAQVAFFRNCRPETSASFPTRQTFEYPSTMHISSELGTQPRTHGSRPPATRSTTGSRRDRAPVRVVSAASPLLRTVYLPNEQAAALASTVESLQQQLVAHQQLSDERIQVREE